MMGSPIEEQYGVWVRATKWIESWRRYGLQLAPASRQLSLYQWTFHRPQRIYSLNPLTSRLVEPTFQPVARRKTK